MKVKKEKFERIISVLDTLIRKLKNAEKRYIEQLTHVHPNHLRSARNLIHYRELRRLDQTALQRDLGSLGLSSMTHSEQHVLFSLYNVKFILEKLLGGGAIQSGKSGLSYRTSKKILSRNTRQILGSRIKNCRVRLMVTIPTVAADQPEIIDGMILRGMSMARINCAHDDEIIWGRMIENIRNSAERHGRPVKIAMDLGGPKIRTGPIIPEPRVLKINPKVGALGNTKKPGKAYLVPGIQSNIKDEIPVDEKWFLELKVGDWIKLTDTRGKKRELLVTECAADRATVETRDRLFLATETALTNERTKKKAKIGLLPYKDGTIFLTVGDQLILDRPPRMGEPAYFADSGGLITPARISCIASEVVESLEIGDRVRFDDGKISGKVSRTEEGYAVIDITSTKGGGVNLKADKGINFPKKKLRISGLTSKDKEDLKFIVRHADAVNLSFIQKTEDIQELFDELEKLSAKDQLAVILKIETQGAYNKLNEILLKGMQAQNVGVLIARGDLAMETGWEKMGIIQEEILSICASAHVPVIWATQVLESLAKDGVPSRAEITDAITSIRAEGVMLNKGPFINDAMELLTEILIEAGGYRDKSTRLLHELVEV